MRLSPLLAAAVALAAVASPAAAQQRPTSGARVTYPSQNNLFSWERGHHGFRSGFPGLLIVERPLDYARDEREPVVVKVETPPPPAAVPLPTPSAQGGTEKRKPYVIGASYASLPGGCMKLIEEGTSFFYCSGEWYRQVGEGRSVSYKAVARKL